MHKVYIHIHILYNKIIMAYNNVENTIKYKMCKNNEGLRGDKSETPEPHPAGAPPIFRSEIGLPLDGSKWVISPPKPTKYIFV